MNAKEFLSEIHSYYEQNEPESLPFIFFPPATSDEIEEVQTALGSQAPLPDDLRQLYLQHGTILGMWDDIDLIPLNAVVETQERLLGIAAKCGELDPTGPVSPEAHTATRIPFAIDSETTFSIDLAPPPGGKAGQIVRLDLEYSKIEVVASSLLEFLESGLERLRAGINGVAH